MLRGEPSRFRRGCNLAGDFEIFKGPDIGHFWGLGGPGGPENLLEGWGASPPTFLEGFRGPRDHPDPQNDRSPILQQGF